jgi:1,4-alpha-glucan branching enzyme
MRSGYLCLVLHAHLPFVRHPEFPDFLEEDWLFEAISETYLPLIELCRRLLEEEVPVRLTVSITPTLAAMLEDPLLQHRYLRHIERLCDLSAREVERTRWLPEFHGSAVRYHQIFTRCRELYADRYRRDLIRPLRGLQEAGALEIITSGATHGFLPLMLERKNLWRAQVLTAVQEHRRHFGRPPRGIWLPECGYDPGVEAVLKEAGLSFFFTEAHGVRNATPRPRYGVYAPILSPSGVAVFGRDLESARQVWCSWLGYPGDFDYREFYRDIGWDLDYEYIRPYLHEPGDRTSLGIKYYRITGPTTEKEPYDFERARSKAVEHARHFLSCRRDQTERLAAWMKRPPLVVAPYDAELFGHWWYEGPIWLEHLFRGMASEDGCAPILPSDYLAESPPLQVATPSLSSWGLKGYAEHWLDPSNDWLYPHLHLAGERMIELANRHRGGTGNGLIDRALRQAGRELLLAQSSDWAFILKAGTATEYAARRSREHIISFTALYQSILSGRVDEQLVRKLEERNNLFPNLDYRVFADPE